LAGPSGHLPSPPMVWPPEQCTPVGNASDHSPSMEPRTGPGPYGSRPPVPQLVWSERFVPSPPYDVSRQTASALCASGRSWSRSPGPSTMLSHRLQDDAENRASGPTFAAFPSRPTGHHTGNRALHHRGVWKATVRRVVGPCVAPPDGPRRHHRPSPALVCARQSMAVKA
jgi:hypothetical protein